MAFGVVLGAPKIITVPDEIRRTLGAVQMDTCAFVGVAPKGPVRRPIQNPSQCFDLADIALNWSERDRTVAVEIDSWDQYLNLFGGFEGPGRLPYAVANFFEQGGRRAYICRIVHQYETSEENLSALAITVLPNLFASGVDVTLTAKNEGIWGNKLRAAAGYDFTPVEFNVDESDVNSLRLEDRQDITVGALLRVVNNDPDNPAENYAEYRFVDRITPQGDDMAGQKFWQIDISTMPLPHSATGLQLVQGQLVVEDISTGFSESFAELSFCPSHARFYASILLNESTLVDPTIDWLDKRILPQDIDRNAIDFEGFSAANVLAVEPASFAGGEDRYADIVHEDFYDASWVLGNELPGAGIQSLTHLKDCSLLAIPDLYVPLAFEPTDPNVSPDLLSGAEFAPCIDIAADQLDVEPPKPNLPGLILDPTSAIDRQIVIQLQQRVVRLTEQLKEFVYLMDVPPGLTQRQILQWRTHFNSAFAAAYHPWLKINDSAASSRLDDTPVIVNPSAAAAGIIAVTELTNGIAHGPANRVAQSVFALDLNVSSEQHDQLHPLGVNVFKQQRDGVWLTGARTLSQRSQQRQLSVVRLMVMLRRALLQQMQWLVFEPNTPALWLDVQFNLQNFLRQLYIAGTFKGETEQQAFFVKCDETLNTRIVVDAGQLIAEIGVAPVEPLEFILLRINRAADGTLKIVSE